jgi:hypothetical protein
MDKEELNYLLHRANSLGIEGYYLHYIVLPTSATQNITDTVFVTTAIKDLGLSAADTPPWEE